MNTEKLKELREKHPSVALELDLISGRVSPETGLENPDYKPDEMQDLMEFCVLEVMDVISEQGHSGFSHGYLVSLLIPLLRGLPITPLTGNDWEWMKGLGGGDYYQNKRCFSVFKDGANAIAYNTNGYAFSDNGGESYYTCAESHKNITFPCTSKDLETEYIVSYVEVPMTCVPEELKNIACGTIKDSGDRTEFATGAVRDMREGKGRCDLMPLHVLGDVFKDGIFTHLAHFLEDPTKSQHLYDCLNMAWHMWDSKPTMFLEVAKHFEEGAKKYGENNWQKGIPVHCYIDSAVRHYLKWLRGDKDEPHDRAFVWNLMCCIWEVDYSPRAGEETSNEPIVKVCDKPESGAVNIPNGHAYSRLGDCGPGLFEFAGDVYVKTSSDAPDSIRVIRIDTGDAHWFNPDILVKPCSVLVAAGD